MSIREIARDFNEKTAKLGEEIRTWLSKETGVFMATIKRRRRWK